jgi:hypothetical protein
MAAQLTVQRLGESALAARGRLPGHLFVEHLAEDALSRRSLHHAALRHGVPHGLQHLLVEHRLERLCLTEQRR